MSQIRALIFDAGGVLVRHEDLTLHRKWEARLPLTDSTLFKAVYWTEASVQASLGIISHEEAWRDVALRFHLDDAALAELCEDFYAGGRRNDQLVQFIQSLRPRYQVAVLSDAWLSARRAFTDTYHFPTFTDLIVISAEESLMKPDERIFRRTTERLGVQPEETIFVDDTPRNVEGARAIGMKGVLFQDTPQVMREIRSIFSDDT